MYPKRGLPAVLALTLVWPAVAQDADNRFKISGFGTLGLAWNSTGQAHPPRQARNAEDVIRMVAAEKGAIGLLLWTEPDRRVKVVLALDQKEAP